MVLKPRMVATMPPLASIGCRPYQPIASLGAPTAQYTPPDGRPPHADGTSGSTRAQTTRQHAFVSAAYRVSKYCESILERKPPMLCVTFALLLRCCAG
jgi:hypothetical protein